MWWIILVKLYNFWNAPSDIFLPHCIGLLSCVHLLVGFGVRQHGISLINLLVRTPCQEKYTVHNCLLKEYSYFLTSILSGLRNCFFLDAKLFFLSGVFLYFLISHLIYEFLYDAIIMMQLFSISDIIVSIPVCSCLFLTSRFPIWYMNFFMMQ